MKTLTTKLLMSIAVLGSTFPAYAKDMADKPMMMKSGMSMMKPDMAMIKKITANWPTKISETVMKTIDKYGMPSNISEHEVVWYNSDMSNNKLSPFKMVRIKDTETPHKFPVPHTDFMKHTVNYAVPADKGSELAMYDGSVTYARTRGELSAECDTPEHNILALNLANDIVMGKKSSDEARAMFAETITAEMKGEKPEYEQRLMFTPKNSSGDEDMKANTIEKDKMIDKQ